MRTIILRPADPERDFGQLAAWFSILEGEPNSEAGLKEYFDKERERTIQRVAEDEQGQLMGFYWIHRRGSVMGQMSVYLFVRPEQRGQGIGCRLYEDLTHAAETARAKSLRVSIWDDCPQDRTFAEHRGFIERSRQIVLELNLDTFNDRPYDATIAGLKSDGFRFTSMEKLRDTADAQRKLYVLNDATGRDIPGSDGEPSWSSFEDFRKSVCQSDWYKPGGQFVAIDTASGTWAAMCAITRFDGADHAYTLHIGVESRYRRRNLGQAVQVLALLYARDVLKTHFIRNTCNSKNLPVLALNRKLGYERVRGTYLMEKVLG
jgi:RimJ/RimL family protein N-acetyltransferase/predicted GNAT family acetyltransferase